MEKLTITMDDLARWKKTNPKRFKQAMELMKDKIELGQFNLKGAPDLTQDQKICQICLETIVEGEQVHLCKCYYEKSESECKCNKIYHPSCTKKWIQTKKIAQCPNCKHNQSDNSFYVDYL